MCMNKWYTVFQILSWILVFWDVKPQGWVIGSRYSFKTSQLTYPAMQHHIQDDWKPQLHFRKNLKIQQCCFVKCYNYE